MCTPLSPSRQIQDEENYGFLTDTLLKNSNMKKMSKKFIHHPCLGSAAIRLVWAMVIIVSTTVAPGDEEQQASRARRSAALSFSSNVRTGAMARRTWGSSRRHSRTVLSQLALIMSPVLVTLAPVIWLVWPCRVFTNPPPTRLQISILWTLPTPRMEEKRRERFIVDYTINNTITLTYQSHTCPQPREFRFQQHVGVACLSQSAVVAHSR